MLVTANALKFDHVTLEYVVNHWIFGTKYTNILTYRTYKLRG
ncbi:hypothetical protein ABIB50_003173 [Mucilaginibacter sp. UYCu711]